MKRESTSKKSKSTSKSVKHKFDLKDNSFFKMQWKSPNDGKENTINMGIDFKDNSFIKIKDNH